MPKEDLAKELDKLLGSKKEKSKKKELSAARDLAKRLKVPEDDCESFIDCFSAAVKDAVKDD